MPGKLRRSPGEAKAFKRADGIWCADVVVGRHQNGKQKTRRLYATTRDEVLAMKAALLGELASSGAAAPAAAGRQTFGQLLTRWLETKKPTPGKSTATYRNYQKLVDRVLFPALGGFRVRDELGPEHLAALYRAYADKPRQALYLHQTAHAALAWATKQRPPVALYNAADLVDPKPSYRPPEKRPLAGTDHARLLAEAEARGSPYAAAWALLVYCGLRPSEMRALKWTDVAADWGSVTVERSRSSPTGKDGAHASKSRRAKRALPLPETAAAILRRHRERQQFRKKQAGYWHEMGLVVTNDEGEPPNYRTMTRAFKTMCKHAGLPTETTIYSLRHGYATELLAAGVPLHEVSWLLGHASVTLTVDTYSHRVTHRDAAARAAIERAIGGAPAEAAGGADGA